MLKIGMVYFPDLFMLKYLHLSQHPIDVKSKSHNHQINLNYFYLGSARIGPQIVVTLKPKWSVYLESSSHSS